MGMQISNQNQNMNNMMEQNQFMGMQIFNMPNQNDNLSMNAYRNNINNKEDAINSSEKINFTFETENGAKIPFYCDENITVEELLKLFINKVGLEYDLIKKEKIYFIFNAQIIDINDKRKIKEVFRYKFNIIIVKEIQKFI